jgi:hypothetical protein
VPEIVDISTQLEELFPLGAPPFVVELIPGATGSWVRSSEPVAIAIVRTITWDVDPERGTTQIRDIKEQELNMGWPVLYDDRERVAAFVAALGVVLAELDPAKLDTLMPIDVICVDALKLQRARTQADFEAALRAKGRLGRYLR